LEVYGRKDREVNKVANWLQLFLDIIAMALGVWLTYSAWKGYQRSKIALLRNLSIFFFSFGFVYLVSFIFFAKWVLEGEPGSLAIADTAHHVIEDVGLIIALYFLMQAIKLQPRWRKPLEKKPLPKEYEST